MQREFKFRAWIKSNERMEYCIGVNPFYVTDCDRLNWKYEEVELMQYSGIKDKNEKEIYEGDIVKWKFKRCWKTEVHISQVIWDDFYSSYKLTLRGDNAKMRKDIEYEIIGNIYKNPDLLEAKSM